MVEVPIWWRCMLFFLALGVSFKGYGEKVEDIFEKDAEEKVEASSTFFITPKDIKKNYRTYHRIDRSITKMDRFTVAEHHHYNLQNLGNNWTAAQHIFYVLPKHIGATYGLSAYDFYFQNPQDLRYYCMPSAYTHFNIVLANLGSFVFDSCYTQTLLENWHIGINWRGAMTENEWPSSKDDKIVNASPHFDIFTHVKTPDECYHLFTSLSNMQYVARETGGIRSSRDTFDFTNSSPSQRYSSSLPLLTEAYMENKIPADHAVTHKDFRRNFYLYHHYEFNEQVQLYHELNYNRKNNLFEIKTEDNPLLDFIAESAYHNLSATEGQKKGESSKVAMQSLGNEIGLKGDIERLRLFYGIYYRLENIHMNYDFSKPNISSNSIVDPVAARLVGRPAVKGDRHTKEHYLGSNTRLNFTNSGTLCLDGEYLFPEASVGYYKLNATYQNNFFKLAYNTVKYKTPYLVQYGYSSYRKWQKHFVAPSAQQISTEAHYAFPGVQIHPLVSLINIQNHIYYKKVTKRGLDDHCISKPVQATAPINLLSWGGSLDFCFFSYFHFDHTFTFLNDISNGHKIFKGYIPPYIYTGRYYYAHQPYHKKMDIETGANIHFKDLYYADGYDIVAQQFYRQNQFAVQGRPIIDLFLNFRINNLKFSLKYSYLNEDLQKPKAYFATPFYPGPKKAADIGVHWSFFD